MPFVEGAPQDETYRPLHYAARRNDMWKLRFWIERDGLDLRDPDGRSALHAACEANQVDSCDLLKAFGIELDVVDQFGETPLHAAARAGHVRTCEWALRNGIPIDARNLMGQTPLMVAAESGKSDVCRWLISNNANVDMVDQVNGDWSELK
eukprot:c9663_g1_i3.p1 GENE.c9663_g1_i3~~c9663_g1_i3.p1  ORF type:complete len:162 (+),score=31.19 c9663_g1_i3:35-487(+)